MSVLSLETGSRWTIAAAGAAGVLVIIVGLAGLARVTPAPVPEEGPSLSVRLTHATDTLLREEVMMADLTPLFLPTEYNARLPDISVRPPDRSFLDADPTQLTYSDAAPSFAPKLPPVAVLNGKPMAQVAPLDAMVTEATIPLSLGFGRNDGAVAPLPSRGAVIEVVSVTTSQTLLTERLPVEAQPPSSQPWQPLQLSALVNATGLVGPLETTASSRVEAVDAFFKNYLVQRFRIGNRLPPGYYRITVGP